MNIWILGKDLMKHYLTIENIKDVDHRHAKRVFKSFNNKNFGDYHDLYVQSDTLLFADVFENFRDQCIEIYELVPAHFLTVPGLAWKACLKISEMELELLKDADMLLMIEKGISRGLCQAVCRLAFANNKYMKNHDKSKKPSYIQHYDENSLYA